MTTRGMRYDDGSDFEIYLAENALNVRDGEVFYRGEDGSLETLGFDTEASDGDNVAVLDGDQEDWENVLNGAYDVQDIGGELVATENYSGRLMN